MTVEKIRLFFWHKIMNIIVSNNTLTQQIGEELVLLEIESGGYFGLKGTGLRVWELLTEFRSLEPIIEVLSMEYAVDKTTLREDIEGLLVKLEQAGLIICQPCGA